MADQTSHAVNVTPFAAQTFWADAQHYEIWWEDPRDLQRVVLLGAPGDAPRLEYWRHAWPEVRVAKGAVVGAGESGWLANDDWTNGAWQAADTLISRLDGGWVFTFQPLNRSEFPALQDFPADFRRTLKIRLAFDQPGAELASVEAYSDSRWQETDVTLQWRALDGQVTPRDGRLEAFNGQILRVSALDERTHLLPDGSWQSGVKDAESTGVRARVRYAFNEDPNSFDRTILTLRSDFLQGALPGVSFFLDDILAAPVYVKDLGILAHTGRQDLDFAGFETDWASSHRPTLYQQIGEREEQSWERAWGNMPRKQTRMYYTLGCEGSRQKYAILPNGDVFLTQTWIKPAPGKDTPRMAWDGGELRIMLGLPEVEPGYRAILDGYLPVVKTVWTADEVAYEQEAYATWLWGQPAGLRREGDDPVIGMMQLKLSNLSGGLRHVNLAVHSGIRDGEAESLAVSDGWVSTLSGRLRLYFDTHAQGALNARDGSLNYTLDLPGGETHTLTLKLVHLDFNEPAERERIREMDYEREKQDVIAYWRERTDQGAQIHTPNETLNNFYRTHLMHMLVINDREPGADRQVARCGGFYYGSFPDEGCMAITDLDRRGYHAEAERCLELYVAYQGTVGLPGNFQSKEGVFYGSGGYEEAGYNRNHGWVLWCLAEHYRYTRDRAWLERVAPALVKACDWIIRERQVNLRPGTIQYGFLPSGSLEDVTDYWTWLPTNAYASWGFRAAAEVLGEIGHPEAERLTREAQAYTRDLTAGFYEACARSPVIRLRSGAWVPHFPARQERRGRDFGWLREVLEGACHLVYCGLIDARDLPARWIIEDYEDNLFLSEGYGYQAEDFEQQWFDLGGFSMQSNLLLFPPLYLWRDEPKHYLRGDFNAFTSAFFPDTVTMCEHALPDLTGWRGDHFKSSDEANSNGWLRSMFFAEDGPDLWVGQAIPREWMRHGQKIHLRGAPTHFGPAGVEFLSQAAVGAIDIRLDPPTRNPPRQIYLRARHPEGKPIQAVWVDGLPYGEFHPENDTIVLRPLLKPAQVRVLY